MRQVFIVACTHRVRMPFVVKEDLAFDPVHAGALGTKGVMFGAYGIAHLVEQQLFGWRIVQLVRHGGYRPHQHQPPKLQRSLGGSRMDESGSIQVTIQETRPKADD